MELLSQRLRPLLCPHSAHSGVLSETLVLVLLVSELGATQPRISLSLLSPTTTAAGTLAFVELEPHPWQGSLLTPGLRRAPLQHPHWPLIILHHFADAGKGDRETLGHTAREQGSPLLIIATCLVLSSFFFF